ncbi:MAG: lipopolysaccharide assembly protein LapA domain-containing protein [Rhodospirillales bacterium]
MQRVLLMLAIAPPLLLLALFAGSNRVPVVLKLWPTDLSLELPLALAILGAAAFAFLGGGLVVWAGSFRQRRKLRRSEEAVRLLEEQIRSLRAQYKALPPPAS